LNTVLRRDFVFSDVFSLASPPYTSRPDIDFFPQDKELSRWAVDLLLKGKVSSTKDGFFSGGSSLRYNHRPGDV